MVMRQQFIEAFNAGLFSTTSFDDIKRLGLDLVAQEIGADGSVLIVSEAGDLDSMLVYHFGDTPSIAETSLPRAFFSRDPIIQKLVEQMRHGTVGVARSDDVDFPDEFRKSDVYREVYLRHNMMHSLSAAVAPLDGAISILSLYRANGTSFTISDAALVRAVMPAFGNALRRVIIEHDIMGCLAPRGVGSDVTMRILRAPDTPVNLMSLDSDLPIALMENSAMARTRSQINSLTDRERQIAHLVTHGLTNSQIARETGLSCRTVEFHISSILRKLDVQKRTGLCHLVHSLNAARPPLRRNVLTGTQSKEQ